MVKKIKLMSDYQCWPLWYYEGFNGKLGVIDPNELPLSSETTERLLRWAKTFDATLNLDDPLDESHRFSKQELEEFEQEGINLWQKLQKELGSNYEVLYHSQKLHKDVSHPDELSSKQ